ncbi:MAG: dTDP-4-dehydrorhamnose reductase [Clostridiaceae bacterium]|jgi:dTDP-4-dehydrorhamnose reductase|nr:dTDP-4-dehydrorhamnose reductase [Clostridiaceae bacterium]
MKKILILGGSGLLGKAIINEMNKHNKFQYYITYFKNPISLNEDRSYKMNIEDIENVNSLLNTLKPDIIVSCLRGDFKKQLDIHIKAAEYLKKKGGSLYFFSTTNVFDNDFSRPHYEGDLPNSCTEYGQFKIECERRITDILHDNACILRLPQVWGKDCPRIKEILSTVGDNKEVLVYPKLFHNTNINVMIARQLCYIMDNNLKGTFHLASEDVVNYKDFYNDLIKGLGLNNAAFKEDFHEEGYFALLSKRNNEFPKQLIMTNKSVVNYLIDLYSRGTVYTNRP